MQDQPMMSNLDSRKSASSEGTLKSIINPFEFLGSHRREVNFTQDELERIQVTKAMIPSSVRTVLDVGCGDGRIIKSLIPAYKTVGLDYAFSSIAQFKTRGVQGSSGSIPFRDRSFDLVMCCEVLEHLDDILFRKTITEMIRVSRQYVLISVPYKENLRQLLTKCPRCHRVFHIWGHCRSFSESKLDKLFNSLRAVTTRFSGQRSPYFSPIFLSINQRWGNKWEPFAPTTMCPQCGNTEFKTNKRNPVTITCGLVHLLTNKFPVSKKNWILKLYAHHG